MPWSIDIDTANRVVVARMWGTMDGAELLSYHDSMESIGPLSADIRLLLLMHPEIHFDLPTAVIRETAKRTTVFSPQAPRVIVAPRAVALGLGRLYAMETPTAWEQYKVVQSVQDACDILGIDPERIDLTFPE